MRPYWQPDFTYERRITKQQAIEELRELLTSAVQMRMRSDVPLGAFLSGGVDSSIIVALMQQHSAEPVKTFTIGFPVKEYDETEYRRRRRPPSEDRASRARRCSRDAVEVLPKLACHYDEPFADSSAIPTWYVSQLTRQHVTVALTGDGGDELFAGYPRYRAVALAGRFDRVPAAALARRGAVLAMAAVVRPAEIAVLRQIKRFSEALGRCRPSGGISIGSSIFHERQRGELYRDEFLAQLPTDPVAFLRTAWQRAQRPRRGDVRLARRPGRPILPCDFMTKVDIASMAHGLECRAPFLDYRVVEFAASLPIRYKYRRGRGKWILREAFGDLLPRGSLHAAENGLRRAARSLVPRRAEGPRRRPAPLADRPLPRAVPARSHSSVVGRPPAAPLRPQRPPLGPRHARRVAPRMGWPDSPFFTFLRRALPGIV